MRLQGEICVHEVNLGEKCGPKTILTPNTPERSEGVYSLKEVTVYSSAIR